MYVGLGFLVRVRLFKKSGEARVTLDPAYRPSGSDTPRTLGADIRKCILSAGQVIEISPGRGRLGRAMLGAGAKAGGASRRLFLEVERMP